MSATTEWISAIGSIFAAAGTGLIWIQIRAARKEIGHDHERSRRERAVELLIQWNEFERTEGNLAIPIAERLDAHTAAALWGGRPFEITHDIHGLLVRFLSRRSADASLARSGAVVHVNADQSVQIRSGMVECMNLLETIFSAAKHNVADSQIIEEQFECLIEPNTAHKKSMMRVMREAAGGAASYPRTTEFDAGVLNRKACQVPKAKTALG